MNSIFKKWIIAHRQIIVATLLILVGGYYLYLTNLSQIFHISEMYYSSDEYSMIVMKFDGTTLSTYLINPNPDIIASRTDYLVGYRKYNEDIAGNFWSDEGIEPFGLRGSDIAGRLYAECVGAAVWPVDGEMLYYNQENIHDLEDYNDTSYSFGSRFSIKEGTLRVYNYAELDFQETEEIPKVEAEIMRLIDSQCPPEF